MDLIEPDWPAPAGVRACSTRRLGGFSLGAFASLNLGDHVGDDPERVARNREALAERLGLSAPPAWLRQVHGRRIVAAGTDGAIQEADGSVASAPGRICVVMTADCLPLLLCDDQGRRVAAVHAGWRGLRDGVIESAVAAMGIAPGRLLAWLGPAIGPDAFEVGPEVRAGFVAADPECAAAFRPGSTRDGERWLADLFLLARLRLDRLGVTRVHGGGDCTFSQPREYFSYRRDGTTGRMASLIWLAPDHCNGSEPSHV